MVFDFVLPFIQPPNFFSSHSIFYSVSFVVLIRSSLAGFQWGQHFFSVKLTFSIEKFPCFTCKTHMRKYAHSFSIIGFLLKKGFQAVYMMFLLMEVENFQKLLKPWDCLKQLQGLFGGFSNGWSYDNLRWGSKSLALLLLGKKIFLP